MFVDNVGHLAHLHARDTSLVLVSRAPMEEIAPYKERMGWTVPWFSSFGSDFNTDFGGTIGEREKFGLSVFFRRGVRVFQTYFTEARGVEALGKCRETCLARKCHSRALEFHQMFAVA